MTAQAQPIEGVETKTTQVENKTTQLAKDALRKIGEFAITGNNKDQVSRSFDDGDKKPGFREEFKN